MTRRILFVRAVNVGGTGKLPMAEFRALLEELGGDGVQTYVASGNAVGDFAGSAAELEKRVSAEIEARHGIRREVFARTPAQVRRALEAHPFPVDSARYSYVCFLDGAPTATARRAAADVPTGEEEWSLAGGELQLRYANGQGRSTLDLARLLKRLGVQGTARNLATVQKVIDLAG